MKRLFLVAILGLSLMTYSCKEVKEETIEEVTEEVEILESEEFTEEVIEEVVE